MVYHLSILKWYHFEMLKNGTIFDQMPIGEMLKMVPFNQMPIGEMLKWYTIFKHFSKCPMVKWYHF